MPTIHLETFIRAPIGRCFDQVRSVEAHTLSTSKTRERAVSPLGPIGLLADRLFLASFMRAFLGARANALKHMAEADQSVATA